ncbi:MAG: DMT family transporter [Sulfurimonas sp.]|nr:DMT family transporter [Sulfurimonas sp.]MBU3939749.1 DMT family transporter [bacterium]MBU4024236.1 DMT family transporter [bacterium]MBU4058909.1 DMT family transporter [bacterium]MBU4110547.1 DMT family transporter [bacterium]
MNRIKNLDAGVKYMLLASLTFAFMGAFAKLSSLYMPSLEVVFFRNIAGVVLIGLAVLKKPMTHVGGKPWLLLFRGTMGFLALLAFFYNIAHISLGDAMTFSKTSTIFTAIFAWIFLKEKLTFAGWLAIGVGFVGIVMITQPSGVGFSKYDLLGIFSGIGAALAYTSIRELKKYYDTRAIVLSFMGVGTAGPILLFLLSSYITIPELDFMLGEFVMPSGVVWFYVLGMGLFATLSQVLMTKAYSQTQAGIVATVSYMNIPFSIAVGVMLGDSLPSMAVTFGIVLIILSGIMVARAK